MNFDVSIKTKFAKKNKIKSLTMYTCKAGAQEIRDVFDCFYFLGKNGNVDSPLHFSQFSLECIYPQEGCAVKVLYLIFLLVLSLGQQEN